jgi:Flp pilus assembly protein TadG
MRTGSNRGNAMIEFTLVGIPLIFIVISIFEVSRGMWIYHTLAYATKDAARFAAVHGHNCVLAGAACPITVSGLAAHLKVAGVGLLPDQLNVTFSSTTRTITCSPLNQCNGNTNCFPAGADCTTFDVGGALGSPVTISATYPFRSAISMFWPGAGKGQVFGTFQLPAQAVERIAF